MKTIGIAGMGKIGWRLQKRLEAMGHKVVFTFRRKMLLSFEQLLEKYKPDAVFVAISTLDQGEAELALILACAKAGIPVITCAKGALAYHAKVLNPFIPLIGYSAAVGGGTGILQIMKWRSGTWDFQPTQIFTSINGSFSLLGAVAEAERCSVIEAAEAASAKTIHDGCAEPGVIDGPSFLREEGNDVKRKTCIVPWVISGGELCITPNNLEVIQGRKLDEIREGCRFVVSFTNYEPHDEPEVFGEGFRAVVGKWHLTGGWRLKEKLPEGGVWIPPGAGNAIHVTEGELGKSEKYSSSGPGAGAEPTTTAMINDLRAYLP